MLGQDSPPQAGHAVHGHTATGVLAELGLQQVEPIFHNLAGRRCSIIKWPILQGWEERNTVKSLGKISQRLFFIQGDRVWGVSHSDVKKCHSWAHSIALWGYRWFCGIIWHTEIPWLLIPVRGSTL